MEFIQKYGKVDGPSDDNVLALSSAYVAEE